jgi:hypothetical protein
LLGIDTTQQSEAVLASRKVMNVTDIDPADFVDGLVMSTKECYEDAVYAETGKLTHAGSQFADAADAMTAIDRQPKLFEQHWEAISAIQAMGLNKEAEKQLLKMERKQTAAAIVLATLGVKVESNSDASVLAEVESGNYDGDCPDANANGMNQSGDRARKIKCERCPICGTENVTAAIDGEMITGSCGCWREICSGKTYQAKKTYVAPTYKSQPRQKTSKQDLVKANYGEHAEIRTIIGVGDAPKYVYDKRTGDIIDRL